MRGRRESPWGSPVIMASVALFIGAVAASVIAGGPLSIWGAETTTTVAEPEPEATSDGAAGGQPAGGAADEERGRRSGRRGDVTREAVEEGPHLPVAPGKATAAGEPEQVAREFADAWINRPSDGDALRRQNQRLVALSRGSWADNLGATLKADEGSGSRGEVVGVQALHRSPTSVTALVTTREQLAPDGESLEPFHFGLYLVRLERAGGGFAVSSWEPQF
jgi:hypothetical protein